MTNRSSTSLKARREEVGAKKRKQRRITAAIAAGALVVLTGIVFLARQVTSVSLEDVILPESLTLPANADGTAWGPVDAPVVIEEFSDFQ